ncbi:MAG: hypothetical protein IJZ83_00575 [Clostridia bacterium]|nr:hypothetical protein [Clostridia bacterium]
MQYDVAIKIFDVSMGKNKNWLEFKAVIGSLDGNSKYTLSFCGTELLHSLSLPNSEIDYLRDCLCQDFGFAPYKISDIKKILGDGKIYIITRGK